MKTSNEAGNIDHFFESLRNPRRTLTEWEENFLSSIEYQYNQRGSLSDKQFEILERIYSEKT